MRAVIFLFLSSIFFLNAACDYEEPETGEQNIMHSGESITIAGGGELSCELRINASLIDCGWDTEYCESIRLNIGLSTGEIYSAILYGGEVDTDYVYNLANVDSDTEITIEYDPDLSVCANAGLIINSAECICSSDEELATIRQFAPLIEPADYQDYSDVPMILLAKPSGDSVNYTLLYSNEDGGTGVYSAMLVDDWGRFSDIETVLDVNNISSDDPTMYFQGAGHSTELYEGDFVYDRPALKVATTNGMVSDDIGSGPYLCPGVVLWDSETWFTREQIQNHVDGYYRVVAQEVFREEKSLVELPANTLIAGDARYYLYLDYDVDEAGTFKIMDSGLADICESEEYSSSSGRMAIWCNQPLADSQVYLLYTGDDTEVRWVAIGYHEDLLIDVNITDECISGSIYSAENPCLLWNSDSED